jgi:hypothetical protein
MLVVKINSRKDERTNEFKRSISNIVNYVHKKIFGETKVISDDDSVEIISGSEEVPGEGQVVAELLIKKTIVINSEDFSDKRELDKFLKQIKHFCDQAKSIEEVNYVPMELKPKE